MGLFDVIRYPVTDIFDSEQMDPIPKEIIIPWLNECYDFYSTAGAPNNFTNAISSSSWIQFLIVRSVAATIDVTQLPETHNQRTNFLKECFTRKLRDRIRMHE